MFKKILILNRGEVAVRILRTCREMGLAAVTLYEPVDVNSLHVRLADQAVRLETPGGFRDVTAVLAAARRCGADALHPGYGFLAEEAGFAAQCEAAGLRWIGPPPAVLAAARHKVAALEQVRAAGHRTLSHSPVCLGESGAPTLAEAADQLGYPLVVKSCSGGRGRGARLVRSPDRLAEAVRRAQQEAEAVYGDRHLYLEGAILPAHQIGVQVLGDHTGCYVHLGEREGSLVYGNQKVIEETPAPCLSSAQREQLWRTALDIARLFRLEGAATIEFIVDGAGQAYFTEIKARLQVEHPVTEIVTRVDLVREQIRLAAGERLTLAQADVPLAGWGMLARLNAEDPSRRFLPSPGRLRRVRLPSGPEVRVDTYVYSGCEVPANYDPLLAKLTVWGADRPACLQRLRRALTEFKVSGPPTNLPLLQRIVRAPEFAAGVYDTDFLAQPFGEAPETEDQFGDLAALAAVLFERRRLSFAPTVPDRARSGWHRASRRLPE